MSDTFDPANYAAVPALAKAMKEEAEYIAVSDKTSEVLKSSTDRFEVIKLANLVRRAGGEVTIFRSTKL